MLIRIPIPNTEHAIEFDSDKIDAIQLPAEIATHDGKAGFTGRSKLILEFAAKEDAPKWVQL